MTPPFHLHANFLDFTPYHARDRRRGRRTLSSVSLALNWGRCDAYRCQPFANQAGRRLERDCQAVRAFAEGVKARYPGIAAALLNKVSETEALFVGVYEDPVTMQEVSSNVAAPWFAENIRPFLAGPANRSAGEVIAGFRR